MSSVKAKFNLLKSARGPNPRNKLFLSSTMLAILLLIGTIGYHVIEPSMSWFDGFYMTVITISTVGFGELDSLGPSSRPLTLFLIFSGLGLISYTAVTFSQVIFEGELAKILGRRKLDKKIASLKDHVIICGYGKIGAVLADSMKKYGKKFIVVDNDEEKREELAENEYLFIIGDATSDDTLEEAGIKRASKLIAATNSDAQNVFIVLTARELNPGLFIQSRAYFDEAEKRLIRAGANKVTFPDRIGGYRMAMSIIRPTFTNFVDVVTRSYEEGEIAVDELTIGSQCRLIGVSLMNSNIRQEYNLIVIAIRDTDGNFKFNPDKDTEINEGDTLIAMGLRRDLNLFENNYKISGA